MTIVDGLIFGYLGRRQVSACTLFILNSVCKPNNSASNGNMCHNIRVEDRFNILRLRPGRIKCYAGLSHLGVETRL